MRAIVALVGALLVVSPAGAEIYRWTDAQGRMHFAQSLNQVPAQYRRQAEANANAPEAESSPRVQTYSGASGRAPAAIATSTADRSGRIHRVRVARAGTSMLVNVRLNESVTAPFLIDTGASDVLVPQAVADELGLDTGPGVRTKRYSTANGMVEHPAVMLRSVRLGSAKVDNVPASVSPSMSVGLLGLSFFNHFTYNIDAAQGVVTLQRNALARTGQIRGGRSRAQWGAEYANIDGRIRAVRFEYEQKSEHKNRVRRQLEAQIESLERQREKLEEEADQARVPMAWRR